MRIAVKIRLPLFQKSRWFRKIMRSSITKGIRSICTSQARAVSVRETSTCMSPHGPLAVPEGCGIASVKPGPVRASVHEPGLCFLQGLLPPNPWSTWKCALTPSHSLGPRQIRAADAHRRAIVQFRRPHPQPIVPQTAYPVAPDDHRPMEPDEQRRIKPVFEARNRLQQ